MIQANPLDLRQSGGEPSRRRMIVRQSLDVVPQRIYTCGGNDPRLAHRAPEELLVAPCLSDERLGAGQYRPNGATQALGQVQPDGIEKTANLARWSSRRDGRVHQSCAVEMHQKLVLAGDVVYGPNPI